MDRKLIADGLLMELPEGYKTRMRARSRLAIKKGISVLNNPETSWFRVSRDQIKGR